MEPQAFLKFEMEFEMNGRYGVGINKFEMEFEMNGRYGQAYLKFEMEFEMNVTHSDSDLSHFPMLKGKVSRQPSLFFLTGSCVTASHLEIVVEQFEHRTSSWNWIK